MTDERMLEALQADVDAWPAAVKAAGVKNASGSAYRPVARNNEVLRTPDDPQATYDVHVGAAISRAPWARPRRPELPGSARLTGTAPYERAVGRTHRAYAIIAESGGRLSALVESRRRVDDRRGTAPRIHRASMLRACEPRCGRSSPR